MATQRFRKMYLLAALVTIVVFFFILNETSFSFRSISHADDAEPLSDTTPRPHSKATARTKDSTEPHSDRTSKDSAEPHSDRTSKDSAEPHYDGTVKDSAEPHSDSTAKDSAEPHSDSTAKDSAEPHSDSTAKDSAEPHSDSTAKDSAEPHSDSTAKDSAEPHSDSTAKDSAEPHSDSTAKDSAEPHSDSTAKDSAEPHSDSTAKDSAEPHSDSTAKDSAEPHSDSTAKDSAEPHSDGTAKDSAEPHSDGTAKDSAEPHSDGTAKDSAEPHSDGTAKDSAEPHSDSTAKDSAEPHSDGTAKDSAEPHSDGTAKDSAEPHSDSTAKDSAEPHSDGTAKDSAEPHSDSTVKDSAEPHSDSTAKDSAEPHSDSTAKDSAEPHSDRTTAKDSVSQQPTCNFLPSDSEAPVCPLCTTPTENITEVSVYLHDFDGVNQFWGGNNPIYSRIESQSSSCELSSGVKCRVNHDNQQSDGVVLFTRSHLPPNGPLRYCYPQVVILFNTEVEHPGYDHGYKPYAEVMYDYHLKSDIRYIYPCAALQIKAASQPPNPKDHSRFAMLISNCGATERYNYVGELMNHIQIDSYGRCHHNMDRKSDRYVSDWPNAEREVLSKYRLAIAYENTISPEYITEKAFLALSVGAIPVYKGPPEIYSHIPDRHNIINIDDYASPAELAKYLQRVLDDDELYLHHATLDMAKVEEYKRTICSDGPVACQMCERVYQLKVASLAGGSRPCSCALHNQ